MPLLSLTLLNHRFTLDMSDSPALRLQGSDAIGVVYSLAFQRQLPPQERQIVSEFVEKHGVAAFCRAILNSNELIDLEQLQVWAEQSIVRRQRGCRRVAVRGKDRQP